MEKHKYVYMDISDNLRFTFYNWNILFFFTEDKKINGKYVS